MKIRVKIENEVYDVEVGDLNTRPVIAKIDGEVFEVWPEETQAKSAQASRAEDLISSTSAPAAPLASPPAASKPAPSAAAGEKVVAAPIPGVVISITVKEGQTVESGDELLILEAMKMKNAIRASRSGTIAAIHVVSGDTVSHGQALLEFTD